MALGAKRYKPPWNANYIHYGSFRGIQFRVDAAGRASGRRAATHEFPHRDMPYTEDLGRRVVKIMVTGYVIAGPGLKDYIPDRNRLVNALEEPEAGQLILPRVMGDGTAVVIKQVVVDTYSVTERREKGGYAEFEMTFIEQGNPVSMLVDTQGTINNAADAASQTTQEELDRGLLE